MKISIKDKNVDPGNLALVIQNHINLNSRFTCDVILPGKTIIKLKNIRLRESRKYCGNHPNACEIGGAPSRSAKYLEGADWVEFNDMINDILDALEVTANVATAVCKVRKLNRRRVHYGSHMQGFNWQWNMDEDDYFYVDWNNSPAPNSTYPYGTPGIYERKDDWVREMYAIRYNSKPLVKAA
jgi:hypothetical protein